MDLFPCFSRATKRDGRWDNDSLPTTYVPHSKHTYIGVLVEHLHDYFHFLLFILFHNRRSRISFKLPSEENALKCALHTIIFPSAVPPGVFDQDLFNLLGFG